MNVSNFNSVLEKFTFKQVSILYGLLGCIGYLRADFGASGKEFYSTWNDLVTSLKTKEFRKEFDEVINTLRFDKKYEKLLGDRTMLSQYCHSKAHRYSGANNQYFGVRIDTDNYTYLLRLNPRKGDYNLYCYCYVKETLNRYLEASSKGIRFITPRYNENFRISDGGKIFITEPDGTSRTEVCRYYDDYHTIIGNFTFHICEFAEITENRGAVIKPYEEGEVNGC